MVIFIFEEINLRALTRCIREEDDGEAENLLPTRWCPV